MNWVKLIEEKIGTDSKSIGKNVTEEKNKEQLKITEEMVCQIQRPRKQDVFMMMAFVLSLLSMDSQTKMGAIITNSSNHIIGGGYNSFPMGCPDHELPNVRPYKYPFVIHSESNALSFCLQKPENGILYVTGEPCLQCVYRMWQEGISKVYYIGDPKAQAHMVTNDSFNDQNIKKHILKYCPIEFIELDFNANFIVPLLEKLQEWDFLKLVTKKQ